MIPVPLSRAATDERLTPMQVRVLVILHRHLTYLEYRPVKLAWLARLAGLKDRSNARKILAALVAADYLLRGPAVCEAPGRCYISYALAPEPVPAVVSTATVPAA